MKPVVKSIKWISLALVIEHIVNVCKKDKGDSIITILFEPGKLEITFNLTMVYLYVCLSAFEGINNHWYDIV